MPPKDITQCNCVAPTAPTAPEEADVADPGQVEQVKAGQRETKSGKYGATPVKTHTKNEENKDFDHWIEVELIDDADQPVPGEPVQIELPDGTVANRTTDEKGVARVEYLPPGSCKITFTKLDKDAWEPA